MECAGNGRAHVEPHVVSQPWLLEAVGTARWSGVPVASLLEEVGVLGGAIECSSPASTAASRGRGAGLRAEPAARRCSSRRRAPGVRGQRRPAPAAARVPAPAGRPRLVRDDEREVALAHHVVDAPFDGYQMRQAYRVRHEEDEGRARSAASPRARSWCRPGIPEFLTRARSWAGACEWSAVPGRRPEIVAVRRPADGGATWARGRARRADPGPLGVAPVALRLDAQPGEHELCCRARDASGNEQPLEPAWNVGGYVNNAVQRVAVTVTP